MRKFIEHIKAGTTTRFPKGVNSSENYNNRSWDFDVWCVVVSLEEERNELGEVHP